MIECHVIAVFLPPAVSLDYRGNLSQVNTVSPVLPHTADYRSTAVPTNVVGGRLKMREWKRRERLILMQNVMLGPAEKRMVRLISREIIFEEFQRI